ncbi:DNA-binding response regulator [Nibricoccus aquaticus]|uniref:DNA-binding response regulator n=1 Tax=Nibricoccus aquaticus TaxID=2576891 RepID=A0A290QKW9_9BACT|nr:response regulator transcription factor [Nibricoccus aquaticus]ATC64542.1 DNA-binding response regulator [Nibricoccus aquaticus]
MKKILVVDDEAIMRRNLGKILRLENFDVHEAGDGREGVELARTQLPDLILCDISMPLMDGHAVLKALREIPHTARIPFIFLTARGEHSDVRSGMTLGADDYLIKPVGVADLLAAIGARLSRIADHNGSNMPKAEPKPEMLQSLGLTPREAEVLFWVSQGKSNPEVCTILEMKLFTVKKHLENIYVKLGVENRTAASAMALEKLG